MSTMNELQLSSLPLLCFAYHGHQGGVLVPTSRSMLLKVNANAMRKVFGGCKEETSCRSLLSFHDFEKAKLQRLID